MKVYFGTPYSKYRSRISAIYQPELKFPTYFIWNLLENENQDLGKIFNMQTAREAGGKPLLASKPLLFKLLEILTRDFYRPTPVGSLVAELYPDEYFNPITSPQKAYKAVIRLRDWFQKNNIPLDVVVEIENYQLIATGPYSIRVNLESTTLAPAKKSSELEVLSQHMERRPFTTADAARVLKMSPRTAQRFLEKVLYERKITKTASGRSTRYRFLESFK